VASSAAFDIPTLKFLIADLTPQEGIDFFGRPRSETRYVSIINPDKRDERNEIRKEQMRR
jgi:hypothetical protein